MMDGQTSLDRFQACCKWEMSVHDSNYMIFDTVKDSRKRTRHDDAKRFE